MGDLKRDLSAHTVIGVDTAAFIYLWEQHPRYASLSEILFCYLDTPHVRGVTSIITLIEVCVLPRQRGRLDLVQAYERALLRSRQVEMLPVGVDLARRAVALRAEYGIRVPDALQIAAALVAGATAFVTNDRRLTKVRDLHVLVLDAYT